MCQNIQCLTNKIDDLNVFLSDSHCDVDIIVINEHWLSPDNYHLYPLDGYDLCAKYLRQKHIHGGVAIFTRNNIKTKERLDIQSFTIEFIVEFCAIEIINCNLILISIYRPERETECFFTQMQALLEHLSKYSTRKKIIIAGDINIDVTEKTKHSQTFVNLLESFGFRCLIDVPTRVTLHSSACIDQFITSENVILKTAVSDCQLSDHKTLFGKIPLQEPEPKSIKTYKIDTRVFSKNKMELFRKALSETQWQNILSPNADINKNYDEFIKKIKLLLDTYIPRRKIKLVNNKKTIWMTKGIKKCCYHKRILRKLANRFENESLKTYSKLYSKLLKKIIASEKRKSNIQRLLTSQNKNKAMWGIIKEKTNSLKHRTHENLVLNVQNENVTSPVRVAETFNKHYLNINCSNSNTFPPNHPCTKTLSNSFYLGNVTESDVKKAILQIKRNNTSGYDDIPGSLMVHCVDEFVPPLTFLVNQSYSEGRFPESLKLAVIKPIYKKGGKTCVSNYRPIALLSVVSKIFESLICKRIYNFFEKFNVINCNQHGFRKNRSTTSAVFDCTREILNALNDNKCAIAIFMDLSKAYDRVSHNILLKKLELLGMRGQAKKWLSSYLSNRRQIVQITHLEEETGELRKYESSSELVPGSIPQGSVLGCLLFLSYINELPSVVPHKLVLFADDATLIIPCDYNDVDELHKSITHSLTKIAEHLKDINLVLNYEKTRIMQFRPYQRVGLCLNVTHEAHKIEEVDSFSLLGIKMDSHLSWKFHIESIAQKLSRFSYALRELRKCTNEECALVAYHSYAAAWIRYGIALWGNSTDVSVVFILQKRCLRIIALAGKRDTCRDLFVKFRVLTLTGVYIYELCRLVKKHPQYFNKIGDKQGNYVSRRREKNVVVPPVRLAMFKNGSYYMALKVYNHLPNHLKALQGSKFEIELKTVLISKAFYNIKEYFERKL